MTKINSCKMQEATRIMSADRRRSRRRIRIRGRNMKTPSRSSTPLFFSTHHYKLSTTSIHHLLLALLLAVLTCQLTHANYNGTTATEVVEDDDGPHYEPLVQASSLELLSAPLDTGSQPAPASSAPGRPGKRTAYACEEKHLQIECQLDESIRLIRAIYGRFSIQICNDHGQVDWKVNCMSPSSSSIIKNSCQDQQSCHLLASSSVFGDPCPGTQKYLEVHYECLPARNHTTPTAATTTATAPPDQSSGGAGGGFQGNRPLLGRPLQQQQQPAASKLDVIQGRPHAYREPASVRDAASHNHFWLPTWITGNHLLPAPAPPQSSSGGLSCPETTLRQMRWPRTEAGQTVQVACPQGALSDNPYDTYMASLSCSPQGTWAGHVQAAHCQSLWLRNLTQRLELGDSLFGLLEELVQRTRKPQEQVGQEHLFGDDLLQVERVLWKLADELPELLQRIADDKQRFGYAADFLQRLADLISNLAHECHSEAWADLSPAERRRTASRLIQSVEAHGALLASMASSGAPGGGLWGAEWSGQRPAFARVTENNYLFVHLVPVQNHSLEVSLPQPVELLGTAWMKDDESFSLHLKTGDSQQVESASGSSFGDSMPDLNQPTTHSLRLVFALLKGLATHLEPSELSSKTGQHLQVNSHIASLSILGDSHTPTVHLSAPFQLQLKHLHPPSSAAGRQPICAFWDTNSSDWQSAGCSLVATNRTHSTCACNHLTLFALLSELDQSEPSEAPTSNHFALHNTQLHTTPVQLDTFQDGPILLLANGRLLYVDKLLNGHLFTDTNNKQSLINGRFLIYLSCLVSAAVYGLHLLALAYNRTQARKLLACIPSHPAPPLLVTVRNSASQQSPTYTSTSSADYSPAAPHNQQQQVAANRPPRCKDSRPIPGAPDTLLIEAPTLALPPVHLIVQLMALYLLTVLLVDSQHFLTTERAVAMAPATVLEPIGLITWTLVLTLYYLISSLTCWLLGQLVWLDLSLLAYISWLRKPSLRKPLHATSASTSSDSSETKSSWMAAAGSGQNPASTIYTLGGQSANFYKPMYGATSNQTARGHNSKQQSSISPSSSSYASSSMVHPSEPHHQQPHTPAPLSRLAEPSEPSQTGPATLLLHALATHVNLIRRGLVHGLPVLLVCLVGWRCLGQSSLINEHFYTSARLNQLSYWPLLVDACSRSLFVAGLLYYAPMVCLALIACALFALKRCSSTGPKAAAASEQQPTSHLNPYGGPNQGPQLVTTSAGNEEHVGSNQFGARQPLSKHQLGPFYNGSSSSAPSSQAANHCWQMEQIRKAKCLCLWLLTLLALHTLSWICFFAHLQQSLAGQPAIEQLLYVFALSNLLLTGFLTWFQRHSIRRAAQLAGLGRLFSWCCECAVANPNKHHRNSRHSIYGHAHLGDDASGATSATKSNHQHMTGGQAAVKVSPSSQSLFLVPANQQQQQQHQPATVYQVNSYQFGGPLSAQHLYQQLASPQHIYDSTDLHHQHQHFSPFEPNINHHFQLAAHLNRSVNSLNQIHLQHSSGGAWPASTTSARQPATLKPQQQPQLLLPEALKQQQQQHLFSSTCIQQQQQQQQQQQDRRTQGISGEAEGPLVVFSSGSNPAPPPSATFGPHSSSQAAAPAYQHQHHQQQQLAIEHQRFSGGAPLQQSGAPQELRTKSPGGGDRLRCGLTSGEAIHHHQQQLHQYYSINNQTSPPATNYTDALKAAMIEQQQQQQQQQNESSVAQHFRRANSKHQRQLASASAHTNQQQSASIYDVANYGSP